MSNTMSPNNAQNDDQRFEQLVEQYQEEVLRICFLYLSDQTLAEDAVQETFLKVYRSMGTFRGNCSEKTWIMKIAMHACYDINRSGWFRMMNRRITPDMLPEPAAAGEEQDEELTLAVMQLPRKEREVLLLYYYQGMKVQEIAQALHLAHSSVSGRLKRGRERMKKLLEGSELDE